MMSLRLQHMHGNNYLVDSELQACDMYSLISVVINYVLSLIKGETTVKNMCGDTVIGEQVDRLHSTLYMVPVSGRKTKHPRLCFAFSDGSNSFLKVSSDSGGIDVYVGDGGTAELHSQQGKHTLHEQLCLYLMQLSLLHLLMCHIVFLLHSVSYVGAVSVRVPSSLRAGVRLCGTSVDISPEVVLHGVENSMSEGHTTVTGKLLTFFITLPCGTVNVPYPKTSNYINNVLSIICLCFFFPSYFYVPCSVFLSGYMNVEPPANQWVKAQADRGSIRLTLQSWFESRRLVS